MKPGVYIHIPFCSTRCTYCNFNFVINYPDDLPQRYIRALLQEINHLEEEMVEVDSIHFGGGTPSIIPAEHIEDAITHCKQKFQVAKESEITIELNPESVTQPKAQAYKRMGINRVSLGAQSFNDLELRSIGRDHAAQRIIDSCELLRREGFNNINLDLILGLPRMSLESWMRNLEQLDQIRPSHVSVYILEIDPATKLGQDFKSGKARLPEDEFIVDGYFRTIDFLESRGYQQYEISNFAQPGFASRHNLKYWSDVPYYGFGAGSHSYFSGYRYHNELNIENYIRLIETTGNARVESIKIDRDLNLREAIFLGLRKIQGIDLETFEEKYNTNILETYSNSISEMRAIGLLELDHNHLKLTKKGLVLSNEVFQEFLQ